MRVCFHCLRHHPSWWSRDALSRGLRGEGFAAEGGAPGCCCRACFRTVGMGDRSAVDIAHRAHQDLLHRAGAMNPRETVEHQGAAPPGPVWELLYMDDHWATAAVPIDVGARLADPAYVCLQTITSQAREAYLSAGLPRASEEGGTYGGGRDGRPGWSTGSKKAAAFRVALVVCASRQDFQAGH